MSPSLGYFSPVRPLQLGYRFTRSTGSIVRVQLGYCPFHSVQSIDRTTGHFHRKKFLKKYIDKPLPSCYLYSHGVTSNTWSLTMKFYQSQVKPELLRASFSSYVEMSTHHYIFSDYDITVVYVWATYCGPCKEQMDKYAAMYDELPDNVNLVGLMLDVYDGLDTNVQDANDIMNDAGASFTNIRASDDLYEVLSNIQYTPSSFFVDREGHIVGGLLAGAGCSDTKKELEKFFG